MFTAKSPRLNSGEMAEIHMLTVQDSKFVVLHVTTKVLLQQDSRHIIHHVGTPVPGC